MARGERGRKRKGKASSRRSKAKGQRGQGRWTAQLKSKERRGRQRRWAALIVGLILLVMGLGSYLLLSQRGPGEAIGLADAPRIEVIPRTYDFGIVSQAAGVVTTELTVENRGGEELVITGMRTSCGCTQASLIVEGEEGPLFGMHNNPVGWRARLAPGEQAKLKVYYDPNVHPVRGPVTRTVEIYSNDPKRPVYRVRIELYQTG